MKEGLTLMGAGVAMVVCGLIYGRYPNLFRRGLWMKTSIAIRTMTPDAYVRYIKRLGQIYIVTGVLLLGAGLLLMMFHR
jgi:hypothetical protein